MDDALRPKAAAKRAIQQKASQRRRLALGAETQPNTTISNPPSSPSPIPTTVSPLHEKALASPSDPAVDPAADLGPSQTADFDDPFTKPLSNKNQLNPFDNRLYLLQQGVSSSSGILPLSWSKVVRCLIEEALISNEQLAACGGRAALKVRYEKIRVIIQNSPSSNMEDESRDLSDVADKDFDIFDLPDGGREWRRKNENTQTRWDTPGQAGIDSRGLQDEQASTSEDSLMDQIRDEISASIATIPDESTVTRNPVGEYIDPAMLIFDANAEAKPEASSVMERQDPVSTKVKRAAAPGMEKAKKAKHRHQNGLPNFQVHEDDNDSTKKTRGKTGQPLPLDTSILKENQNELTGTRASFGAEAQQAVLSETPSPAALGHVDVFPTTTYPTNPHVTMWTPINAPRRRPVATDFYNV